MKSCETCLYTDVCMYKEGLESLESAVNLTLESENYSKELSAFDVEILCKKYKKKVTRTKKEGV